MTHQTIGVLVIHGMGSQGISHKPDTSAISFSRDLHDGVASRLSGGMDHVAWHEVSWAHVTQSRQEQFLKAIKKRLDWDAMRGFVMHNLSDAASYRKSTDRKDRTYTGIHQEVDKALTQMQKKIGPTAPIIVVAHSLGAHIMSNYIYDAQSQIRKHGTPKTPALKTMRTVVQMVTFGCNIPVFVMGYDAADVVPIGPPNADVPPKSRVKNWWVNFFDRDDVLGYELAPLGDAYQQLADTEALLDVELNVGGLTTSWNPLSHGEYWKDPHIAQQIAMIAKHLS